MSTTRPFGNDTAFDGDRKLVEEAKLEGRRPRARTPELNHEIAQQRAAALVREIGRRQHGHIDVAERC
ncbi:MAG TPA: hypothetical protein VMR74_05610 [Gammaproteobacteria bacterium]|nr:hypothetical protein [Gammaproteobacteria bacterium]